MKKTLFFIVAAGFAVGLFTGCDSKVDKIVKMDSEWKALRAKDRQCAIDETNSTMNGTLTDADFKMFAHVGDKMFQEALSNANKKCNEKYEKKIDTLHDEIKKLEAELTPEEIYEAQKRME